MCEANKNDRKLRVSEKVRLTQPHVVYYLAVGYELSSYG